MRVKAAHVPFTAFYRVQLTVLCAAFVTVELLWAVIAGQGAQPWPHFLPAALGHPATRQRR